MLVMMSAEPRPGSRSTSHDGPVPGKRGAFPNARQQSSSDPGRACRYVHAFGGGTGSIERTAAEPAITEVAAGSGLYGPALFDAYRAFTPRHAAMFALPVVRTPSPGVVTVLGRVMVCSAQHRK